MRPKSDCLIWRICPVPLQVGQVSVFPYALPVPPHLSQGSLMPIFIVFSTPLAIY